MLSGTQRSRIAIYNKQTTASASNARIVSYAFGFNIRANVQFVTGAETDTNGLQAEQITNRFKVYHRPARFNVDQIIQHAGAWYNIRSIEPDSRRGYLIIMATRIIDTLPTIIT